MQTSGNRADFNTSHVNVNPGAIKGFIKIQEFQYISC